ncbi:Arginine metabolism regulation protein II [Colletotrichum siamense]|uniref:Arginine metabolism regulation protein II n=1 Tax=Colletotrichum siamense TaxID=690259 RepID=UPI00187300DF|nr:Arginine metabolism regulation protein II [Colletotrichum siamense]KAF5517124.1 Arginine metabolism regulation protein II [Colletotrichum siamense]
MQFQARLNPPSRVPTRKGSLGPEEAGFPSRRELPLSPIKQVLSWSQVDGILKTIESFDAASSFSENGHLHIQNFGVFMATGALESNGLARNEDVMPNGGHFETNVSNQTPGSDLDDHLSPPHVMTNQTPNGFASPSNSEAAVAWELCNLHERQARRPSVIRHWQPQTLSDSASEIKAIRPNTSEISETQQSPPQYQRHHTEIILPKSPPMSVFPSQDRFLMHHYVHTVVNIFCVIDNAKSPWKTIHIPRAIQGIGEMDVMGSTSRVRSALRNALLSISGFFLANVRASEAHPNEAVKWVEEAMQYRYNAIGLLKQAVESDLYSGGRPKYKEYLATMLSMITINIMSGDTSTCAVHLDGAKQLISHNRKSRVSGKTRALHRIYFYLRVIYESTAVEPTGSGVDTSPSGEASNQPGPYHSPRSHAEERFEEPTEMASFECIYGIPRSLLVLLKDTTNLIKQVSQARTSGRSSEISEPLNSQCDSLEKSILDWSLEDELARCRQTSTSTSFDIIFNQTKSFHNALIIYFAQNIHLLSFHYLRQYVEAVLQGIEAIEKIKTDNNILAAPIFWPAFIAATEAFDSQQQTRFRKWYERVAIYGIKAVRTGSRVVYEVWDRGPSVDGRVTSLWRTIIEQTGETLMLT